MRIIFESSIHKVLLLLNTSSKDIKSIDTFFEMKDQKILLMDRRYLDEFDFIMKQTDSITKMKLEIAALQINDPDTKMVVQNLVDYHSKNLLTSSSYDIKFYEELREKLAKCLSIEQIHQKFTQYLSSLLNQKPIQMQDKIQLVEKAKEVLLDYQKFYEDMDDVKNFFKNHSMYKSYRKIENTGLFNAKLKEYLAWYDFYGDIYKTIKETEEMFDDPDSGSMILTIPLTNLRAKYFNKVGYGSQFNNFINLLDNFFSIVFAT
jgi:hypothetical protein